MSKTRSPRLASATVQKIQEALSIGLKPKEITKVIPGVTNTQVSVIKYRTRVGTLKAPEAKTTIPTKVAQVNTKAGFTYTFNGATLTVGQAPKNIVVTGESLTLNF
jgi:hypothetical protein